MWVETFKEETPPAFDFISTVRAHGWPALRPFEWHPETAELKRVHRLTSGPIVRIAMQASQTSPFVKVSVAAMLSLNDEHEREIRSAVQRMLRLEEDLGEFRQLRTQMADSISRSYTRFRLVHIEAQLER